MNVILKTTISVMILFVLAAFGVFLASQNKGPASVANEIARDFKAGNCLNIFNKATGEFKVNNAAIEWKAECMEFSSTMNTTPVQQEVVNEDNELGQPISRSMYTFLNGIGQEQRFEIILRDDGGWEFDSWRVI